MDLQEYPVNFWKFKFEIKFKPKFRLKVIKVCLDLEEEMDFLEHPDLSEKRETEGN